MKDDVIFRFNREKDLFLRQERGIGFEEMILPIKEGKIITIIPNPNQDKYPNQKMYVLEFKNYIYVVPFVRTGNEIFLKTCYPSRKLSKQYLGDDHEKD